MRPLVALVFEGLSEDEKRLPSVLFHDVDGIRQLEQLHARPEHYPARAERGLIERHRAEIAMLSGARAALVDYGSGTTAATQGLLAALTAPHSFLPIDRDEELLEMACRDTARHLPHLAVHALRQDYRQYVVLPEVFARARRRIGFFSGAMFGELPPLEAAAQLVWALDTLGPRAALLVGIDLVKSPEIHVRAYDDGGDVAARYNAYPLTRINRELDGTFEPDAFRHCAIWNAAAQRVETSLQSVRTQLPAVAGIGIPLREGEQLVTQCHHAYTLAGFANFAQTAGWTVARTWLDADLGYALQFLEPTASAA
jgi:dimethylhistidine N-methyltransferase